MEKYCFRSRLDRAKSAKTSISLRPYGKRDPNDRFIYALTEIYPGLP